MRHSTAMPLCGQRVLPLGVHHKYFSEVRDRENVNPYRRPLGSRQITTKMHANREPLLHRTIEEDPQYLQNSIPMAK